MSKQKDLTRQMPDLVANWEVALSDGVYKIHFEHGTTSGKRVIWINGKPAFRKDWMFKLVGNQPFELGKQKLKAVINIDACSGFTYEYSLNVAGKSLNKFLENKDNTTKAWAFMLDNTETRVVLEKNTMDVWCNGEQVETTGEFTDEGTETHFEIKDHYCYIRAMTSGNKREGIIHTLHVDDKVITEG